MTLHEDSSFGFFEGDYYPDDREGGPGGMPSKRELYGNGLPTRIITLQLEFLADSPEHLPTPDAIRELVCSELNDLDYPEWWFTGSIYFPGNDEDAAWRDYNCPKPKHDATAHEAIERTTGAPCQNPDCLAAENPE
jgi:hypothetical protein